MEESTAVGGVSLSKLLHFPNLCHPFAPSAAPSPLQGSEFSVLRVYACVCNHGLMHISICVCMCGQWMSWWSSLVTLGGEVGQYAPSFPSCYLSAFGWPSFSSRLLFLVVEYICFNPQYESYTNVCLNYFKAFTSST